MRADVREAIERAFPENLVEMWYSSEDGETWFTGIEEILGQDLREIKGVALFHEREPDETSYPAGYDDDEDEEWAPELANRRSYHLYFLSPAGKDFEFDTEIEDCRVAPDDYDEDSMEEPEWETEAVAGRAWRGWSVAVSLVAPFAAITLSEMAHYENGDVSEPGLGGDGGAAEMERLGAKARETLARLRRKLEGILEKRGIAVLPEEELRKAVPWLSCGEEVFAGEPYGTVRVRDAFFFEMLQAVRRPPRAALRALTGGARRQNINFNPTKIRRSSCALWVAVTCPKSVLVGATLGGAKLGVLVAPSASARNWSLMRSRTRKSL